MNTIQAEGLSYLERGRWGVKIDVATSGGRVQGAEKLIL